MDIRDLQAGDILLFSGEKDSFISQAIMFLTDAPVSHAAMTYAPSSIIVEETPPAIQTSKAAERFDGRTISVMRLNPAQPKYTPVLNAATSYLNNKEPYATANLYLVGMLLIYRRFTPRDFLQQVIIKILKKLTASIIDYHNARKYPGKLPMVCSQFVYQCYEDAGPDYQLQIKNGVLSTGITEVEPIPSLVDQAIARVIIDATSDFQSFIRGNVGMALTTPVPESDEELAKELMEALRGESLLTAEAVPPTIRNDLVVAIHEFSQAIQVARTGIVPPPDELLQANSQHTASESLARLKAEEPIFVTPGDLLLRCQNLAKVGTISG